MTHPFDLVFVALVALVWPLYTTFVGYPRFKKLALAGVRGVRFPRYLLTTALQWTLTLISVTWALRSGRSWRWLGLAVRPSPGFVWCAVVAAVFIAVLLVQWFAVNRSPRAQQRIRERYRELLLFLPHDAREMAAFTLLAITAGVCEEVLFRGFVVSALTPWLGDVRWAVLAAIFAFGFGHAYQGARGIVTSTLAGAVMMALYICSGSLYVPIVLHMATDLIQGRMLYAAIRGGAESAQVAAG